MNWRIQVVIVALPIIFASCAAYGPYHANIPAEPLNSVRGTADGRYKLAFIEFGDQGSALDTSQRAAALEVIHEAKQAAMGKRSLKGNSTITRPATINTWLTITSFFGLKPPLRRACGPRRTGHSKLISKKTTRTIAFIQASITTAMKIASAAMLWAQSPA